MSSDLAPILHAQALTKRFGQQTVLNALEWRIDSPGVIGLLGRNGAGKSTLIRCLLGLTPIDDGSVAVYGQSTATPSPAVLRRIGYVPQSFDLFPWMKVNQYLRFHAAFYSSWQPELVSGLLGRWEVDANKKIGELSQGQRQKLAIIRAIAPDPELLLLDEPVASLDPQTRRLFLQELLKLTERPGKTVIFSTHITTDLERSDAEIALLKGGQIQFSLRQEALKARVRRVRLIGGTPDPHFRHPGILRVQAEAGELQWIVDRIASADVAELASRFGSSATEEAMSLEDIFIEIG